MARDPRHIAEMLELVEMVWRQSPDMRLGQLLVCAAAYGSRGKAGADLFNIEDPVLVAGLERLAGEFPEGGEIPEEPEEPQQPRRIRKMVKRRG